MIVLASYCLNFLHPGYLLKEVIEEERRLKHEAKHEADRVPLKPFDPYAFSAEERTIDWRTPSPKAFDPYAYSGNEHRGREDSRRSMSTLDL